MQKTIWITGASSGIGQEFARRYAKLGCRLILTARRTDRLEALAAKLGTPCRILPADLAKEEDCQRLFKELEGETIDIFINNAGFGVCGSYLETDDAREEEMIRVNVEAMARLFRFAVRRMHAAGGGTILNVASSAGLLPGGPYMAGYYASKAYVVSLTRGVARELQELHSPVYVCALCPGPVDTEFNDRAGGGVCPQGHHAGVLRTGSHARHDAPQDHHRALGLYAGMHHGAEAAACLPADAHCGTAAEKEAGMIFWMAQYGSCQQAQIFPSKLCAPLMTETVYTRKTRVFAALHDFSRKNFPEN